MTKKEQLKLIDALYWELHNAMQNSNYFELYYYKQLKSERHHRKYRFIDGKDGITVKTAAKYFTIDHLIKAMKNKAPKLKDYLHIRKEIYTAYALYHENRMKIRKILTKKIREKFNEIDYVELMKCTQ